MLEILNRMEKTYNGKDYALLKHAYDFSRKAHVNQKRASGEEYFIHPCTVAGILIDLGLDAATVAAAFLSASTVALAGIIGFCGLIIPIYIIKRNKVI